MNQFILALWAALSAIGLGLPEPAIELAAAGWGTAQPQDVAAVLKSAQHELWKNCLDVSVPGIHVVPSADFPITYDRELPGGRVKIGLAARDRYWAQYSFQFAHELGHVLAGHARLDGLAPAEWDGTHGPLGWLEEALCETASLYVLRAMARSWQTHPPYPHWKDYAPALASYVKERMENPAHQIPASLTFEDWLKKNEENLRQNCCDRERNCIIALRLLPVFEAQPEAWRTLVWFRRAKSGPQAPLAVHLAAWGRACPPELRPHVEEMGRVLLAHAKP